MAPRTAKPGRAWTKITVWVPAQEWEELKHIAGAISERPSASQLLRRLLHGYLERRREEARREEAQH